MARVSAISNGVPFPARQRIGNQVEIIGVSPAVQYNLAENLPTMGVTSR